MRIGIYFAEFRPDIGGTYTYVADVFAAFIQLATESEHQYVLLCDPSAALAVSQAANVANVKVVPVLPATRRGKWVTGLRYFSPVFRHFWQRPDRMERVANKHGVELLWLIGAGAFDTPDIPYIATVLDLHHRYQPFFPEVSRNGEWDIREQYYQRFLRRAAYCVTGTAIGKQEIEHFYQLAEPRVRVFQLPTPQYALMAKPDQVDIRKFYGIKHDFVLYPAQFWAHKNHVNLLLAVNELRQRHGIEMEVVLVGSDKGNLSFVKQFADDHGMNEWVHFLGFVPQDHLIALYRQAAMLVYVTYFGPDNIPPLEAFALGCPVIASIVAGAQEQLGDAALLVHSSAPSEMALAIKRLHSDKALRQQLVRRGCERARQWTSRDFMMRMFTLFDEFAAIRRNWA